MNGVCKVFCRLGVETSHTDTSVPKQVDVVLLHQDINLVGWRKSETGQRERGEERARNER
jgi:hypothetical protein